MVGLSNRAALSVPPSPGARWNQHRVSIQLHNEACRRCRADVHGNYSEGGPD